MSGLPISKLSVSCKLFTASVSDCRRTVHKKLSLHRHVVAWNVGFMVAFAMVSSCNVRKVYVKNYWWHCLHSWTTMEPTQSNWWWYGRWLCTDCYLFIVCIHLTWILTSFCLYRSLSSYLTLSLHEARENGNNVIEPDKSTSTSFALWERNLWFLQSMQCDILGHLVFPIHTWMQCWSKCTRLKDANSRLVLIASQNGHSPQKVDHDQMTSDKGIDFLLHNLVYVRIVSSIWTSCKKMRFDLALFGRKMNFLSKLM